MKTKSILPYLWWKRLMLSPVQFCSSSSSSRSEDDLSKEAVDIARSVRMFSSLSLSLGSFFKENLSIVWPAAGLTRRTWQWAGRGVTLVETRTVAVRQIWKPPPFISMKVRRQRGGLQPRLQPQPTDQEAVTAHKNVHRFCPTAQPLPYHSAFALLLSLCPTAQPLPYRSAFAPPLSLCPCWNLRRQPPSGDGGSAFKNAWNLSHRRAEPSSAVL